MKDKRTEINKIRVLCGDSREVLKQFPDGYFNLIVTSPPYADARKKHYHSIKPSEYPEFFESFHNEFWRVLADDGSFVLNIKDKVVDGKRNRYVWRTIMMLEKKGWLCIDDYLWLKPNAMPGYWKNRLRDGWEYCFHMTKQKDFAMYQDAVKIPIGNWAEPRLKKLTGKSAIRHDSENESGFGRDLRNWKEKKLVLPDNTVMVPLVGKNMGHPAVYPTGLPAFFIKLFTKEHQNVLDPFAGSGSTGLAAQELNRNCILIELEEEYVKAIKQRIEKKNGEK